jgi:hypothetical protein
MRPTSARREDDADERPAPAGAPRSSQSATSRSASQAHSRRAGRGTVTAQTFMATARRDWNGEDQERGSRVLDLDESGTDASLLLLHTKGELTREPIACRWAVGRPSKAVAGGHVAAGRLEPRSSRWRGTSVPAMRRAVTAPDRRRGSMAPSRSRASPHRGERGQAALLLLGVMAALVAGALVLAAISQAFGGKGRHIARARRRA